MSRYDTPALRIASTRPGFWRCGVQHPAGPALHLPGKFTREEVGRLMAEPALIVDVLDAAPEETDRATRILSTIGALDKANPDHWTKDGKPQVEALEAASGIKDITAAERDAAWADFRADSA